MNAAMKRQDYIIRAKLSVLLNTDLPFHLPLQTTEIFIFKN